MQCYAIKQRPEESDADFTYRQVINNTLNLVRHYLSLKNISADIRHIKGPEFEIESYHTFRVPTGDGGYYTDTETCAIDTYTWYNYMDALKWVLEQEKETYEDSRYNDN